MSLIIAKVNVIIAHMENIFKRRLEDHVLSVLNMFPGVLLTGARQVGKSTLAEKIARTRSSVIYDLSTSAARKALNNPAYQLLKHDPEDLIVLDEVQCVPGLFSELRHVMDAMRSRGQRHGKFILLGSVAAELQRQSESLVGRIARLQLHGIDALEIERQESLRRLWNRGGFPESYLAENEDSSMYWRNRYLSYKIALDLSSIENKVSAQSLSELLSLLAASQGSITVKSRLADDLDISEPTVDSHLKLLRGMMLVSELPAYSSSLRSRVVKKSKHYIRDSGLLHALNNVAVEKVSATQDPMLIGASWEGFVVENIRSVLPESWRLFHFRSKRGEELDLVIERARRKLWAVEIRSHKLDFTKGNHRAISMLKPERTYLVHQGDAHFSLAEDCQVLPLAALMRELLSHSLISKLTRNG